VDPLSRAYRVMPGRNDLLLDLIIVSAGSGNVAAARSLLDRALRIRGDAELVRVGESAVAHAEIGEAVDLFNAGRTEEAETLLRRALEGTLDPGVRSTIQAQLMQMASVGAAQGEIERYNRAVDAYNAGRIDEGIAMLEDIVGTTQSMDLRLAAAERIKELRARQLYRSQVERYNRAIDVANAGDVKQAVALLEELATETLDPRVASNVEDALAEMRGSRR
jgi:tetratricopeptide (TPR) repeat protein